MSFSEMMESGRGPGVIGTLLALLVLVGFGSLFVFAYDERFQGGQSIESIIAGQAREITDVENSIARGEKQLAEAPGRLAGNNELTALKRKNQTLAAEIGSLKDGIRKLNEDVASVTQGFECYKDKYRAMVRGKAKGETIGRLESRDGNIYQNVTIREVTPVGIQIMHDGGLKRIPYEQLPAPMIDRFQFDSKQKAAAISMEHAQRARHEAAVAKVAAAEGQNLAEKKKIEAEARRDAMIRGITIKQARSEALEKEITALEEALENESLKRISRAPQMRAQLSNKRRELADMQADVARMQADVSP